MDIFLTVVAVLIAITLFAALVRQTMRAERAEAALNKIEAAVHECHGAALVALVDKPIYELGKAEPIGYTKALEPIMSRTFASADLVRAENDNGGAN